MDALRDSSDAMDISGAAALSSNAPATATARGNSAPIITEVY